MSSDVRVSGLEVLTENQCIEYLYSAKLGRIAFQAGSEVEIFPVNYAPDGSTVVFRTAPGTKLDRAVTNRVAFEVDGWDEIRGEGWSVVIKGVAQEVTDGIDPFSEALRSRHVVPMVPGRREHWVAIYPATITGRRFTPA